MGTLDNRDQLIASLRQQLAETRAEVSREVDRTHQHSCRIIALENQLAAQAAELERLRKELAKSTNYITDTPVYAHHVWFASGRHVELVNPQGRAFLNVDMQLHEAFTLPDSNNKGGE